VGPGFLTGRFGEGTRFGSDDTRGTIPRFAPDAMKANLALLQVADGWARRKGVTPAQFALGWLLAQNAWIVPIPGTTDPHHLAENLGAAAVKFSPAELEPIRADLAKVKIVGERAAPSPS
jgi:aryl-alcohol dehydrogenase-like predicted oxidoreductase